MTERITVTLHELVSRLDAYADAVLKQKYGVTFSQFRALATLDSLGRSSITELADCLVQTKAAVSKRVPEFVRDGWMTTSGDPANARRVMLELTPAAKELVATAGGELDGVFTSMLQAAPQIDADALHNSLRYLTDLIAAQGVPAVARVN